LLLINPAVNSYLGKVAPAPRIEGDARSERYYPFAINALDNSLKCKIIHEG
jgi:hypothetical protein